MELTYLFRALIRRKWLIITCSLVGFIAAFLFTMNSKKEYRSVAQLATGFTVSDEIKLSNESFSLPQIELKFNNAIENITSSKVVSLLSYHLMLHDLQEKVDPFTVLTEKQKKQDAHKIVNQQNAIRLLTASLDSGRILSPTIPEDKAMLDYMELYKYDPTSIFKNLQVARYQRTDYINVAYKSNNPRLSAFVVNTLCDEFIRFYGINKRERTGGSIASLDSLVRLRKEYLDQKIAEKNQFMSAEGVVDVNMEGSSKLSQMSSYESELINARAIEKDLSYRISQLNTLIKNARAKGLTSVSAATDSKPSESNNEYIRLRKQYNELNTEYIQKGSNDAELKRRIDNISQAINKLQLADNSITSDLAPATGVISLDDLIQKKIDAEAQLQAISQKIPAIQSKLSQLQGGLNGMAAKGANIEQLNKEIEMASSEYSSAKEQLNVALNIENVPGNFRQTIIGEPALKPESSKRALIIALSGMAALVLSSLSIVFIEFFDQSIKTPTQFQRLSNLPLLGIVNWVELKGNDNVLKEVGRVDEKEKERDNLFRELLRKLRYEIANSNKKIFLFSSTEPQQGKTTLIQALAYSLSLGKKKVLIIDTNFCNNDLTKAINATPVLEKFQLNGLPFNIQDVKKLVTKTEIEGVEMIGCEGGDYTPSEILPKNHLLNYLDELKEEYDYIFLEGAPLNGFTDAKELVSYVEGIIAVFSAEMVMTAADKGSIDFYEQHRDKFIGAILNKVYNNNLDM